MELFIKSSLVVHIVAGLIALLSGLVAILLRRKTGIHKKVGRVYFYAMTVVFVTAVYLSAVKTNVFLFCVAFFTYYSCLTAFRALRLKRLHIDQKPTKLDWAIEVFFGFMHVCFVVFAVVVLVKGNVAFGIVSLVFGLLGVRGNWDTIKRLRGNVVYRNYWLLAHIGGMCGSYIGALTAFFVNNNARFIHLPDVVAWLGPAVFVAPLIFYEVNKHQKKAGKLEATVK